VAGVLKKKSTGIMIAAAIFGLSAVLFWVALRQAFVGDDFIWLYNAAYNMKYLNAWIVAFDQMNGSGFYRPLTQEVFFYAIFHLFGVNALLSHIAVFAVYLLTGLVLYKLLVSLTKEVGAAIAGTAVFLFCNANYVGLSWVAAFSQTGSSLLFVATLYFYAMGRRVFSAIAFLLCLLSGEITSTIPAFIFLFEFLIRRSSIVQSLLKGGYFWLMFAAYVVLRFAVLGIHPAGPFGMANSLPLLLATFMKSLAWIIGWTPSLENALAAPYWRVLAWGAFLVMALAEVIPLIMLCLIDRRGERVRVFVMGLLWIAIGMSPVLVFSLHDYAAYNLAISLIGLAVCVAGAVSALGRSARFAGSVIVMACFAVNFAAIYNPGGNNRIEGSNFYGRLALAYTKSIRHCAEDHQFDTVYIVNGDDALTWALGNQWGARVLARNPDIAMSYVKSVAQADPQELVFAYTGNRLNLVSCGAAAQAH
jgi:hypothetical protein